LTINKFKIIIIKIYIYLKPSVIITHPVQENL